MTRFKIKGHLTRLSSLLVLHGVGDFTCIHLNCKLKAVLPPKFLMQTLPAVLAGSSEQLTSEKYWPIERATCVLDF